MRNKAYHKFQLFMLKNFQPDVESPNSFPSREYFATQKYDYL